MFGIASFCGSGVCPIVHHTLVVAVVSIEPAVRGEVGGALLSQVPLMEWQNTHVGTGHLQRRRVHEQDDYCNYLSHHVCGVSILIFEVSWKQRVRQVQPGRVIPTAVWREHTVVDDRPAAHEARSRGTAHRVHVVVVQPLASRSEVVNIGRRNLVRAVH